jgi:hypothetical protein
MVGCDTGGGHGSAQPATGGTGEAFGFGGCHGSSLRCRTRAELSMRRIGCIAVRRPLAMVLASRVWCRLGCCDFEDSRLGGHARVSSTWTQALKSLQLKLARDPIGRDSVRCRCRLSLVKVRARCTKVRVCRCTVGVFGAFSFRRVTRTCIHFSLTLGFGQNLGSHALADHRSGALSVVAGLGAVCEVKQRKVF